MNSCGTISSMLLEGYRAYTGIKLRAESFDRSRNCLLGFMFASLRLGEARFC
jgi:hypothetical protein